MNIEKKNDNIYTKELDPIDKYLVNIVKRFFQNDIETINNSAEAIILEAVTRAKKEIRLDGRYGVSSVNGKSGGVTLTAADLGAEPMIIIKYSAFNKEFGDKADTVCEGNDPRLSDSRTPLTHKHKATDITTDPTHEFVTDTQITKWDSKADKTLATITSDGIMSKEYVQKILDLEQDVNSLPPNNGDGHNHIPSGGAINNILGWASSGTAKWINGTDLFLAKDGVAADSEKLGGKDPSYYLDYTHMSNRPPTPAPPYIPPTGNEGQIYFIKDNASNAVELDYILRKAAIVESDTELESLKYKLVDFLEVFSSWYRFSHAGSLQPAPVDSTNSSITLANAWTLTGSQVKCVPNSTSFIGFISKDKYSDYILEATVSSTNGDNDRIGVVVAFATDSSGVEHTISALRDMEGGYNWFLVYDYCKSTQVMIGTVASIDGEAKTNWAAQPDGSRIRVERTGDIINVYASPYNTSTISTSSKLTVDLSSNSRYQVFRGPAAYGYGCQSQAESTFTNIVFSGTLDRIYDASKNQTWIKSGTTWSLDSTINPSTEIGVGKFVFNEYTKKLFYVNAKDDIISLNEDFIRKSEINAYIDAELKAKGLIS